MRELSNSVSSVIELESSYSNIFHIAGVLAVLESSLIE